MVSKNPAFPGRFFFLGGLSEKTTPILQGKKEDRKNLRSSFACTGAVLLHLKVKSGLTLSDKENIFARTVRPVLYFNLTVFQLLGELLFAY